MVKSSDSLTDLTVQMNIQAFETNSDLVFSALPARSLFQNFAQITKMTSLPGPVTTPRATPI